MPNAETLTKSSQAKVYMINPAGEEMEIGIADLTTITRDSFGSYDSIRLHLSPSDGRGEEERGKRHPPYPLPLRGLGETRRAGMMAPPSCVVG